jgi:hypothetical protein
MTCTGWRSAGVAAHFHILTRSRKRGSRIGIGPDPAPTKRRVALMIDRVVE